MVQIDVLLRTKRQSISISITPQGRVVVRAPTNCNYEKIISLVQQKQGWIEHHKKRIQQNLEINQNLFNLKQIMLLGETYQVLQSNEIKKINFINNICYIPEKFFIKQTIKNNLIKFYKEIAINVISERVSYFSKFMQLNYGEIKITNSKRNWGSCDNKQNLSFNLRLIMLPHNIIDYVVVHELSHILEFNHSKTFWNIVKSVLPDALIRRKLLKKGDYLLQILR